MQIFFFHISDTVFPETLSIARYNRLHVNTSFNNAAAAAAG